jgi:hypothetical protein
MVPLHLGALSRRLEGLAFEDRGAHEFKGIPGEWRLYAVER